MSPTDVHHFSSLPETCTEPATTHGPQAESASEASPRLRVAASLARGMSVTAAAREAGIHRTTIHHWLRTSKEFHAAVEQARADFKESLADDLLDLAHAAVRTLQDLLSNPQVPPAVRLKAALAVLERPQFPKRGWNLPVRLETPGEQEVVDGMAELEADCHILRMTDALRNSTEPRRSRSGSENVQYEPNAGTSPTVPQPSGSGGVPSLNPTASLHEPRATRQKPPAPSLGGPARNAPCPCGSGQKYKRCCGKDAPPLLAPRTAA